MGLDVCGFAVVVLFCLCILGACALIDSEEIEGFDD